MLILTVAISDEAPILNSAMFGLNITMNQLVALFKLSSSFSLTAGFYSIETFPQILCLLDFAINQHCSATLLHRLRFKKWRYEIAIRTETDKS